MKIEITDVTLRDGLQLESKVLTTSERIALFRALKACGHQRLEAASFVHPKWLPQFAEADVFCAELQKQNLFENIETMAFVPNEKGLQRALKFPFDWISCFVAVSETFNHKNVNATIDDTLAELSKVVASTQKAGRKVRIYVSTVFGCPYEGDIPSDKVSKTLQRVAQLGADEIALSDTIGVALPETVEGRVGEFIRYFPADRTALHLHNTYGMALGSLLAGFRLGVRKVDGSTGGIGGCPYAKGATGNVATEEILYAFRRAGILDHYPLEPIQKTLEQLRNLGLTLHSRLNDILIKGGTLYGLH